jgi:hypothetical protein
MVRDAIGPDRGSHRPAGDRFALARRLGYPEAVTAIGSVNVVPPAIDVTAR